MIKAQHRKILSGIIDQLNNLLADMHNRVPLRGHRSAPPTALVRREITKLHRKGFSQQEIAHGLRISIGRVSETLRGKRK
jgi:DNA-binding CsgD family transcriptional regulator